MILWLAFHYNPEGRKAIGAKEDYSHSIVINAVAIFVL